MKKLLVSLVVTLLAMPAFASNVNGLVKDHYKDVVKKVPHTEQVCQTVEVPIYGDGGFDQGDAIIGGIIGGIIGNQVGKGSGKEAATGVGALTGAIIGGKKEDRIVGYRQEEKCQNRTTYETQYQSVYSHSTVTFWEDGKKYTLRFQK